MSTEDNKTIVLRFAREIWTDKQLSRADDFVAQDYIDHRAMPGQAPGLEGAKQKWAMWIAACPDLRVRTRDMFAEGERVAVRWTADGTHQGTLMGIPASGKHFEFDGISIFRVTDGKVAEQWEAWDRHDLLQQLGPVAASPAAAATARSRS